MATTTLSTVLPATTITASAAVDVPLPVRDAWRFFSDVRNWDTFMQGGSQNRLESGREMRLDSRIEMTSGDRQMAGRIVGFDAGRRLVVRVSGGPFAILETEIAIRESAGGCRISFTTIAGQDGLLFRAFAWLVKPVMGLILGNELRTAAKALTHR